MSRILSQNAFSAVDLIHTGARLSKPNHSPSLTSKGACTWHGLQRSVAPFFRAGESTRSSLSPKVHARSAVKSSELVTKRDRKTVSGGRCREASKARIGTSSSAMVTEEVARPSSGGEREGDEGSVEGKICIVTGANTGMGIVIAEELAVKGAHVVMACRSEERGRTAEEKVWRAVKAKGAKGSVEYLPLDLARLDSVRSFAESFSAKHSRLDRLINNAGIMIPPHSFTPDGFESQFQVNHLSHYLLTRLLLPSLLNAPSIPSIVHISSLAGESVFIKKGEFWDIAKRPAETYNSIEAYRQSKLAQVIFTVEMNRRIGDKVTVNAVHPGIVNTELFNRNVSPLMKAIMAPLGWVLENTGAVYTSEKGASTAIYLATTPREKTASGGYFADCAPKPANPLAFDKELGLEWWNESAKAAGIDP